MTTADTFPRQHARTQRLTLGEPRSFSISPDSTRVVFARSTSGNDPINALWLLDTTTGKEVCVFDPRNLAIDATSNHLTTEELRRRERARESASGVVSYACNSDVTAAVTVLNGQLFHINFVSSQSVAIPVSPGVFDARLNSEGTLIAYVRGNSLCVCTIDGAERVLAHDESPHVTWGMADFIAAEEMGRHRGFWWSPDGHTLVACRVDTSNIAVWHIADPANPANPAAEHRYPVAGATNANVSLHLIDCKNSNVTRVELPAYEYLNSVHWSHHGLIVQVQNRSQKDIEIARVNISTGHCDVISHDHDDAWVELVPGVPTLTTNGVLVTCSDREGVRGLLIGNRVVTPTSLQVRSVAHVGASVIFVANNIATPWFHSVWRYSLSHETLECIVDNDGTASVTANDATMVVRASSLASPLAQFSIINGHSIVSHAETMLVSPQVSLHTVGANNIPVAIITPSSTSDAFASESLPVLFDPYGGPHAQRVVGSQLAFATSQWFADQGFIVVVADGRGTPGKGSAYERAVLNDLAHPVLADQVEVLDALAHLEPRADTSRVGIRGWSFGGYLAALAVLDRPDKFHCAIAGAPVTDWHLYDTHYTERYLGDPIENSGAYESTSLMNETRLTNAALNQRPLLLIHGLADDNVVAAHTLRLSSALLASGYHHEVLPLSGVTHMTPQEVVAENLLLHQLHFIKRSLATGQ